MSGALVLALQGDLPAWSGAVRILKDGNGGLAVGAWSLSVKGKNGLAEVGIVLDFGLVPLSLAVVVGEDSDVDGAFLPGRHLKHWDIV